MNSLKKTYSLLIFFLICSSLSFAQKKVVLDNYFNNEINADGKPFHYLWEDTTMSGFSELGALFVNQGAVISTLKEKPTKQNLHQVDVYIIVDPDTKEETLHPNFMDKSAAKIIAKWVKKGGVLLVLSNDVNHAELEKFNLLMQKFGMSFGNEMLHAEKSEPNEPRNFNSCSSINLPHHPLFTGVKKIFLKEIAPIVCTGIAKPILIENGNVLIAESTYGKGYVLAVGDPWLYNEYINHALLPLDFENLLAAKNLVKLLLEK